MYKTFGVAKGGVVEQRVDGGQPGVAGADAVPSLGLQHGQELRDRFGPESDTLGLRVRTTLDAPLQRSAERELSRQIGAIESGKLGRFRHPRCTAEAPSTKATRAAGRTRTEPRAAFPPAKRSRITPASIPGERRRRATKRKRG